MALERLFFDLDGTLTHPHEGITRCLQHAIRSSGIEPPAAADLVRFVGPPLRDSFAVLLATTDEARLDAAMSAYRTRYEATGIFENAVCPGIPEVLKVLAANGHHLSVVTAKPTVFALRVLQHFGLDGFFSGVYGPDLSSRGYTKSTLIRTALEATGFAPGSVWMIGDRGEDIHGARANGIRSIAVTWGYGTDEELSAARPDRTVRSTVELLECLITGGIQIRQANGGDAEAIALAHLDSIRSIGPAFYPADVVEAWSAGVTPDLYVKAMEGGEAFFIAIGDIDNRPAVLGFSTHRVDDAQDGASVYVRGSVARRAIGTALLRLAEEHALAHGATTIDIQASLAGVEFYRANGFDELGRGQALLPSGHSMACVFMRKLLARA